jgi:hypothetical protein
MEPSSTRTETELEQFRQQWREEVSARNKKPTSSNEAIKAQEKAAQPVKKRPVQAATASTAKRKDVDYSEELEPRAYHDLPDKEDQLKLSVEGQAHDRNDAFREPESALEHYERAVERETQGNLGESMKHYRIAFKVRPSPRKSQQLCCEIYTLATDMTGGNSAKVTSYSSTMLSIKLTNASTFRIRLLSSLNSRKTIYPG